MYSIDLKGTLPKPYLLCPAMAFGARLPKHGIHGPSRRYWVYRTHILEKEVSLTFQLAAPHQLEVTPELQSGR